MVYFTVLADYSFNITATRKIAAQKLRTGSTSLIFSSVMAAKILLFAIVLISFGVLVIAVPRFRENALLLSLALPVVLGWVLYPNFMLLGVQKLGVVALANFLIKASAAALIFLLIQNPEDYLLVPFIHGITQIIVGGAALIYVLQTIPQINWYWPRWRAIKIVLAEGRFVFVSNFFTRVYGFSAIIIGGFTLTPAALGIFAAAAKVITVAQSFLFMPLRGALFPHLSEKLRENFEDYKTNHRRITLFMILISGLATVVIMVGAPWIVQLLFGEDYHAAAPLLQIMAPLLWIGSMAHMSLQQGILLFREDKLYLRIITGVGLLSIGLNFILMKNFGNNGAAWTKLIIELVLGATAGYFFYRKINSYHA